MSAKEQNKLTIGYNFQSVNYHVGIRKFYYPNFCSKFSIWFVIMK